MVFISLFCYEAYSSNITKIILLVNDEPITHTDYEERAKFNKSNNMDATDKEIQNMSINELIEETLMIQESGSIGIEITDKKAIESLAETFQSQGNDFQIFTEELKELNINIETVIQQRKANLAWQAYIRRNYIRLADVTQDDIKDYRDDLIKNSLFDIQRIIIDKNDKNPKELLLIADNIIKNYRSCAENNINLKDYPYVNITNYQSILLSDIEQPFRNMFKKSGKNGPLPAQMINDGIIIYINCNQSNIMTNSEVENYLLVKQIEKYSAKHLRDIRQDSIIEFKER
tara:strand:- start:9815 stop:10678 length:864 start_codon:yes stop_codon:yes gene_type:complete